MYINRTDPASRLDTVSKKSIVARKGKGDAFADTMSSVIEVDVVEIGDHDEPKRRQQQPKQDQNQNANADQPVAPSSGSLDIKV